MIDLGHRRDGALSSAAAGPLLDRHRRGDAEDRINVGPGRRLDELPRVSVERFEITPLPLSEENIESERALAAPAHPGDHSEPIARDFYIDPLQVMLSRIVDPDDFFVLRILRPSRRTLD